MPITFNNGVANIVGTPGAISGVFADQPNAADVAEGTLYFSTDTVAIYQAVAGSWVNYSSGGGGLTSVDNGLVLAPTLTNVQFGGLLIQDTALNCGNFNLDFNNIKVFTAASSNGTNIVLKDDIIYAGIGSTQSGYYLNLANRSYLFGDYGNSVNGTCIVIDDVNEICKTRYNNFDVGLKLDFANQTYYFGDFNNNNNGNSIVIDDNNNAIYTTKNSGFYLDFASFLFILGDYDTQNNGTNIQVNDGTQKIKFKNGAGRFNFTNMPAYTDNADALANGLVIGDLYRHAGLLESQDQLRIVH
jgi:hypothetical protein